MADAKVKDQEELDRKTEINLERAWIQSFVMEDLKTTRRLQHHAEPLEELCRKTCTARRIYQGVQKENILIGEETSDSLFTTRASPSPNAEKRPTAYLAREDEALGRDPNFMIRSGCSIEDGPTTRAGKAGSGAASGKTGRSMNSPTNQGIRTIAGKVSHPYDYEEWTLMEKDSEEVSEVTPLSETSPNRMLRIPTHHEIQLLDFGEVLSRKVTIPSTIRSPMKVPRQKKEGLLLESQRLVPPGPTSCSHCQDIIMNVSIRDEPGILGFSMRTLSGKKATWRTPSPGQEIIRSPSGVPLRTENRLLATVTPQNHDYSHRVVEDAFKMSHPRSAPSSAPWGDMHQSSSSAARRHLTVDSCPHTSPARRIMTVVSGFFCCHSGYAAFRPKRSPGKFQNKLDFRFLLVDFKSICTTKIFNREKASANCAFF